MIWGFIKRTIYLMTVGMFRGEVPCDIRDNRGLCELSSGCPNGENRRVWWRRK